MHKFGDFQPRSALTEQGTGAKVPALHATYQAIMEAAGRVEEDHIANMALETLVGEREYDYGDIGFMQTKLAHHDPRIYQKLATRTTEIMNANLAAQRTAEIPRVGMLKKAGRLAMAFFEGVGRGSIRIP
jgi:hypothetical protein